MRNCEKRNASPGNENFFAYRSSLLLRLVHGWQANALRSSRRLSAHGQPFYPLFYPSSATRLIQSLRKEDSIYDPVRSWRTDKRIVIFRRLSVARNKFRKVPVVKSLPHRRRISYLTVTRAPSTLSGHDIPP